MKHLIKSNTKQKSRSLYQEVNKKVKLSPKTLLIRILLTQDTRIHTI